MGNFLDTYEYIYMYTVCKHNLTILCILNKAHKVTGVTLKAEKKQLQLVSKATMANLQMQQHQQGTLLTALARNLHPKNNSNILKRLAVGCPNYLASYGWNNPKNLQSFADVE